MFSCLLVLCLPAVALGFWGKTTDDERLKEKLQSVKVQLYVAGVDRVRLGRVIVRVAWAHLKSSGLLEALGDQAWVKAVGDFVSAMGEGIGKVPGGLQVSLGGGGWD